jgi:hypothetical protein
MDLKRNGTVVVATLAISHLAVVTGVAAASTCDPAVEVLGDSSEVVAIVADLERRGIKTSPVVECPVVRARIERKVGGIGVAIVDADGRTSERTANGVAAAATLIESWTRTDVVAPLLAPRPEPVPSAAPVPTTASPTTQVPIAVTSRPTVATPALSLTASAETSLATDGSIWFGLSVGVCLRIGPACAGALARVSNDLGFSGESQDSHTGRLATDVLIGAGLPIRRGRLTLMPEMAVGVGWMRTKALTSSIGGDPVDVDSGGLRASASIRMSLSVSTNIALDLGISADVAPLAHTAPYDTQVILLAGEPRGYLRGGLGIRIGAP